MDFAAKQNIENQKGESLPFWKTIKEIPLNNFLECLCNQKYEFLYKEEPEIRDEALEKEHFSELYQQFSEAFNKDESNNQLGDIKRQNILWMKIWMLNESLPLIDKFPEEVSRIFKHHGIMLTTDIERNILITTGKRDTFLREYNHLIKSKEENSKNEMSFDKYMDLLFDINIRFKIDLDAGIIAVYKFCGYYNKFIKSIKEENRLNKKNHGRKH